MTWSNGARYFSPDYGLMAARLAEAVKAAGPLLIDQDGRLWVYDAGVWRPDDGDVMRRTVVLLGERYRPSHYRTLVEFLSGSLERFTVAPISSMINMRNGLLIWDEDPDPRLIEHNDECLSTVQLPIEWNPDARCPEFDAFLANVLPADDIDRAWEVLGYLMMAGNPLQRMFMLSGSGGNGKGVFLNVARALLGKQNFAAVNIHDLAENRFAAADLYGKLANICGEIDATFIERTGRVKELCGDDDMRAENKGEKAFKFRFWGKALFSANAIPGTSDSSTGWTRRWEVLQFPYTPTKADPQLSTRVTTDRELSGIANKAVDALRRLMATGSFSTGESRDKAHTEFADKANKVRRWLDDPESAVTRSDPEDKIFNLRSTLLKAFRDWEENDSGGGKRTGSQKFNELCRQAGLVDAYRQGLRGYYGTLVTGFVFVKPEHRPLVNHRAGTPWIREVHQSAPPEPPYVQPTLN